MIENICPCIEKKNSKKEQTLVLSDFKIVKFLNLQTNDAERRTEMRHFRGKDFRRMSGPHSKETGKGGSCDSQEKKLDKSCQHQMPVTVTLLCFPGNRFLSLPCSDILFLKFYYISTNHFALIG